MSQRSGNIKSIITATLIGAGAFFYFNHQNEKQHQKWADLTAHEMTSFNPSDAVVSFVLAYVIKKLWDEKRMSHKEALSDLEFVSVQADSSLRNSNVILTQHDPLHIKFNPDYSERLELQQSFDLLLRKQLDQDFLFDFLTNKKQIADTGKGNIHYSEPSKAPSSRELFFRATPE